MFCAFLGHTGERLLDYWSSGFSSPEPKAHKVNLLYPLSRRLSVCASVYTFKHEYLGDQGADSNQILSESILEWGKGCIRFWCRSDQNSGFHGNR